MFNSASLPPTSTSMPGTAGARTTSAGAQHVPNQDSRHNSSPGGVTALSSNSLPPYPRQAAPTSQLIENRLKRKVDALNDELLPVSRSLLAKYSADDYQGMLKSEMEKASVQELETACAKGITEKARAAASKELQARKPAGELADYLGFLKTTQYYSDQQLSKKQGS